MVEIERSAGSVEDALEAALAELGLSEQEAIVEIVQEPREGAPAVVRVRPARPAAPPEGPEPSDVSDMSEGPDQAEMTALEEEAELAAEFLEGLLDVMEVDADVEVRVSEGAARVEIWGAEDGGGMGLLIGRHGQTLDALQDLVRAILQRRLDHRTAVVVDVEEYRLRRREQVVQRARQAARRVGKSGRPEALEPMGAFERKVVHDTVAEFADLESASEGEEPNRRVVIRRAR